MGNFAKWIGGGLGFVMGGPIGAMLGFLVGSMVDNTTSRHQPIPLRLTGTAQGDFGMSLLVLVQL